MSFEADARGDGGDDEDRFEHGEGVADADARAAAEGEVGVIGAGLWILLAGESWLSLRHARRCSPDCSREIIASSQRSGWNVSGSVAPAGVAVDDPLAHDHGAAGGDRG